VVAVKLTRRGRLVRTIAVTALCVAAFAAGTADVCWQPSGGYGTCEVDQ
jgi:hypothetical protein